MPTLSVFSSAIRYRIHLHTYCKESDSCRGDYHDVHEQAGHCVGDVISSKTATRRSRQTRPTSDFSKVDIGISFKSSSNHPHPREMAVLEIGEHPWSARHTQLSFCSRYLIIQCVCYSSYHWKRVSVTFAGSV